MKKICLVLAGNIYSTPYLEKYIENNFDGLVELDVIYWNRDNKREKIKGASTLSFDYPISKNINKVSKLWGYIRYRRFLKKTLKNNKYDGIIFLQTISAFFLNKIIRKKYKNRFIVDVRDYTREHNKTFFNILKKTFKESYGVVISSEGYKSFLPNQDYILVHNSPNKELYNEDIADDYVSHEVNEPIVISYIGVVRFYDQLHRFIDKFKNDERFLLRFIGRGSNNLEKYCHENNVKNVELQDYFKPEETLYYYKKTDIVFNLYGNKNPFLDYALSNKLYYAALLNKPIIVSPNTYMEKVSLKYNFGISVDLNCDSAPDLLHTKYTNIDFKKMKFETKSFNEKVLKENNVFNSFIRNFYDEINEIE